jgi:hypothetical protein
MSNRTISDPAFKRVPLIVTVQSRIKEKIIQYASQDNKSYSQYVEELFINHIVSKENVPFPIHPIK